MADGCKMVMAVGERRGTASSSSGSSSLSSEGMIWGQRPGHGN
jgi:hypothetical protein